MRQGSGSAEIVTAEEGCLSLPGIWIMVPRAKEIAVTYLNEHGKKQERRLKEWDARVVQHEVDHLDGVLIVDYQQ
jgi:peptide deformylase